MVIDEIQKIPKLLDLIPLCVSRLEYLLSDLIGLGCWNEFHKSVPCSISFVFAVFNFFLFLALLFKKGKVLEGKNLDSQTI